MRYIIFSIVGLVVLFGGYFFLLKKEVPANPQQMDAQLENPGQGMTGKDSSRENELKISWVDSGHRFVFGRGFARNRNWLSGQD